MHHGITPSYEALLLGGKMDLLRMGARLLLVVACRRLRLFGARAEQDCPYGDVFGARAERDCPYGDVFFSQIS